MSNELLKIREVRNLYIDTLKVSVFPSLTKQQRLKLLREVRHRFRSISDEKKLRRRLKIPEPFHVNGYYCQNPFTLEYAAKGDRWAVDWDNKQARLVRGIAGASSY